MPPEPSPNVIIEIKERVCLPTATAGPELPPARFVMAGWGLRLVGTRLTDTVVPSHHPRDGYP